MYINPKSKWRYGFSLDENIRRIAPYLQLPWDEPTNAEIVNFLEMNTSTRPENVRTALSLFVRNRNAALLPKPASYIVKDISLRLQGARLTREEAQKITNAVWECASSQPS